MEPGIQGIKEITDIAFYFWHDETHCCRVIH